MKIKQTISVIVSCAILGTAAFGANAFKQLQMLQSEAAVVYDTPELAEYAEQVAVIVNQERRSYGLQPVELSPLLSEAANLRSTEIIKNFSHTRPNGTSCFTVMKEYGISYRAAAENIAYGQRNPESVMDAWMNSSGHRANILSKNVDYIGVGVVYRNGTYYWTQLFASSDDLAAGSYMPNEDTVQPVVTTTTSKSTIAATTTTSRITSTKTTSTRRTTTEIAVSTEAAPTTSKKPQTTITKPVSEKESTKTESVTTTLTKTSATDKVTTSCCPDSTTDCVTTTKPVFTQPESGDCGIIGDNKLIFISPEQIFEMLQWNNTCSNQSTDLFELYPALKDALLDKLADMGYDLHMDKY